MHKSTSIPLPNHCYRDSHGSLVTVVSVQFNRVTFYREGYESSCSQPVERFMCEFTEVAQ